MILAKQNSGRNFFISGLQDINEWMPIKFAVDRHLLDVVAHPS